MKRIWIFAALAVLAVIAAHPAGPRTLTQAELMTLVYPSEVAAAPDGSRVYFSARSADLAADRFVQHLYVLEADGGWRRLTHSAEGEGAPRLSPDGACLAFLSARPAPRREGPGIGPALGPAHGRRRGPPPDRPARRGRQLPVGP